MIGKKVVLRVRMSAGEAHYAGDLVNGSHILDFWGDVGTELCIRNDGDESLFVGYKDVEFLAPVYAGDFSFVESQPAALRIASYSVSKSTLEAALPERFAFAAGAGKVTIAKTPGAIPNAKSTML